MKIKLLVIGLSVAGLLAACSKKDEDYKISATKENLVGKYKLTALTDQAGSAAPQDVLSTLESCEKDDRIQLNADLTYNYLDEGTKCTPKGDDNGAWAYLSTTQISIDGDVSTIKSFDGNTLILTSTETILGTIHTLSTTLVKL